MRRLIVTLILLLLLTGCGLSLPLLDKGIIEKAIALQIKPTQQQIIQQAGTQLREFKISHIQIKQQDTLVINNLPAYHVSGNYDLTVELPQRQVTYQQNYFDIYLQLQKEAKSWRLAVPQYSKKDNQPLWLTYLVQ